MALNFPNEGLYVGYQYTGDNGVVYIYDGVKWVGHSPTLSPGTSSLINGSNVVQVDGDGNLVIPVGAIIKDAEGTQYGSGGDRLTNGDYSVVLDNEGVLNFPNNSFFIVPSLYGGPGTVVASTASMEVLSIGTGTDAAADFGWIDDFITPTKAAGMAVNIGIPELDGSVVVYTGNVSLPFTDNLWVFGKDGNLRLPEGGDIKDNAGSSVLGGSPDGGLADNSAGLTITSYSLQSDLGQYDTSGSITYNIRDTGATEAGIIFKGLTADHTQIITGDFNQGDNIVNWPDYGMDYAFWGQVVSVTAYVIDSRGYTFYAVVQDAWEVPHGPCLVEGTQITMADGTHKAIEDIAHGELIRVWNFDLGEFSEAQPIWVKAAEETTGHDVYTFSDGTQLRTVGHHVFNKEAGAFTKLKLAETPVGTTTFNEQGLEVTLVSKERVTEPTRYYNVWTQYHLNLFANGILTSNRFNNIYPIVDMKFVKDDRALRSLNEFAGIDEKYIKGLRLQEQTYSLEYISDYVHNRLEKTDINNQVEQGI